MRDEECVKAPVLMGNTLCLTRVIGGSKQQPEGPNQGLSVTISLSCQTCCNGSFTAGCMVTPPHSGRLPLELQNRLQHPERSHSMGPLLLTLLHTWSLRTSGTVTCSFKLLLFWRFGEISSLVSLLFLLIWNSKCPQTWNSETIDLFLSTHSPLLQSHISLHQHLCPIALPSSLSHFSVL